MIPKPGDNLWFEYAIGMIIPVLVQEVVTAIIVPKVLAEKYSLKEDCTMWISRSISGNHATAIHIDGSPVLIDSSDITEEYQGFYQGIWIDEIIGHALDLEFDNIGYNFNIVYSRARVINKRKAYRRNKKLQSTRQMYTNFINYTKIINGYKPDCPLITTDKKIYMKT